MRFSAQARPEGREANKDRQRRTRAAAPALRMRYPMLATLQLEFEFSDSATFLPSPQVTVYHPPAQAYFCFACPYSDCSGELDLTAAVDQMVNSQEARVEGQMHCTGTRHGGAACTLCLEYSILAQRN